MTSTVARVDNSVNANGSPYIYRISGQNHHRIGSSTIDGQSPNFLQLYVHDTLHEVQNRVRALNQGEANKDINIQIVQQLIHMSNENNELVKSFRVAHDRYEANDVSNFSLRLLKSRPTRGNQQYSLPTCWELAMLVVGDMSNINGERDIIVELNSGVLKRISDLHPSFMALQYPMLFPYDEDGFHPNICYVRNTDARKTQRSFVTTKEFYSYVLQERPTQVWTIQNAGRLYQQYIVNAYTQIEQQ